MGNDEEGGKSRSAIPFTAGAIVTAQLTMAVATWAGDRLTLLGVGRKPLFMVGLLSLPIRCALIIFLKDSGELWLMSTQILDGLGAGLLGLVHPYLVADITFGTGRFNVLSKSDPLSNLRCIDEILRILCSGINGFVLWVGCHTLQLPGPASGGAVWTYHQFDGLARPLRFPDSPLLAHARDSWAARCSLSRCCSAAAERRRHSVYIHGVDTYLLHHVHVAPGCAGSSSPFVASMRARKTRGSAFAIRQLPLLPLRSPWCRFPRF